MRQRRTLLGLSQEALGQAVGVTFQQIQKYERGTNRIVASRLFEFAWVLDVPVSYFFDEMLPDAVANRSLPPDSCDDRLAGPPTPPDQEVDPLTRRETLELVRAYYMIGEARVRKQISDMINVVGDASHREALSGRRRRTKKL